MNEQLQNTMQEAAAKLIEKAMTGIDSATGFLQAEIPEYVYQLMLWYGVKSVILFSMGVMLIVATVFLYRYLWTLRNTAIDAYDRGEQWTRYDSNSGVSSYSYDAISSSFFSVMAFVIGMFISVCFMSNIFEALQIWIAPKVWLVEYASELVK